jgi:hypothetical protein
MKFMEHDTEQVAGFQSLTRYGLGHIMQVDGDSFIRLSILEYVVPRAQNGDFRCPWRFLPR